MWRAVIRGQIWKIIRLHSNSKHMLYVYYGNSSTLLRERVHERVSELRVNGYAFERLEAGQYQSGQLADVVESVSLFGGRMVYLLDAPDESTIFWSDCLNYAAGMAQSDHVFIIAVQTLLAADRRALQAVAAAMVECKQAAAERFNTFRLTNALAERDKKQLWLLLTEARAAGITDEEIIGVLWWQIKTMLLAARTNTAAEAGIKSFPYQKAVQALRRFPAAHIEHIAMSLIGLYHAGHAGERDLGVALEEWVLAI